MALPDGRQVELRHPARHSPRVLSAVGKVTRSLGVNSMARVLLVENERYWLDAIHGVLRGYQVDEAQTFDEALALLNGGNTYDIAIVDINLLEPGTDKQGGQFLEDMKKKYPDIRRIALTGNPPTAVMAMLDQYDLDDVLFKQNIDLSVVWEVVEAARKRALNQVVGKVGEVPSKFRDARLNLMSSLLSWKESAVLRLEQRARTLRNDVRVAKYSGKDAAESASALALLEARQQSLEVGCAELTKMIANICSNEDIVRVEEAFSALQARYDAG